MKKSELRKLIKECIQEARLKPLQNLDLELTDVLLKYKMHFKDAEAIRNYIYNWIADLTTSSMIQENAIAKYKSVDEYLKSVKDFKTGLQSLLKKHGVEV